MEVLAMPKADEKEVTNDAVQRVLSSRAEETQTWDDAAVEVLLRHHRDRAARDRAEKLTSIQDELARAATVGLAAKDDVLRNALAYTQGASKQTAHVAELNLMLRSCNSLVAAPPYSIGGPLQEEFGIEATTVIEDPEAQPVSGSSALPPDALVGPMRTFSQLAIPGEGAVSVAAALGKVRVNPFALSVHTPTIEYPWVFHSVVAETEALGNLGYAVPVVPMPNAPFSHRTRIDVDVDLTIGTEQQPFHLIVPHSTLQRAFGFVHVNVMLSGGESGTAAGVFLEHFTSGKETFGTPTVRWQLRPRASLVLPPGTGSQSMYVGVEAAVVCQQFFFGSAPPPAEDRQGFVGIDLRAPQHGTHAVHTLLGAGGPITVRRIAMRFCPEAVEPDVVQTTGTYWTE
jgi:hypothetical protein